MTTAAQNASPGVYVSDDVGLEVTDGSRSRVQLGLLPVGSGVYGLRVMAADGTTIIIDGQSDMFKISATGSITVTVADQLAGNTTVDLTALVPQSSSLALLGMIGTVASANDVRRAAWYADGALATRFVASASGGAVTTRAIVLSHYAYAATSLVGASTDTPRVTLSAVNETGSSKNYFLRYYMMSETAI